MTQPDWSQTQAKTVGSEIKRLRERPPKRSAQWLSDRTGELGHLINRSTIADLEIGRRKHVLLSELVVIAAALEVPPITLLYPDLPDGAVEVIPGVKFTSIDAAQWFYGEGSNPSGGRVDAAKISVARQYADLKFRRDVVAVDAALADQEGSAGLWGTSEEAKRTLSLIDERIDSLRERMRSEPDTWTVHDA